MKTITLIQAAAVAAFAVTTFAASAAAPDVQKLPRVVVTGKAVKEVAPQVSQLPRVVVTGYATREVAQLPRVIVNGLSEATLLRQQNLAAAPAARRI